MGMGTGPSRSVVWQLVGISDSSCMIPFCTVRLEGGHGTTTFLRLLLMQMAISYLCTPHM